MSISSRLRPTGASRKYELWAYGENSQGECGVGTTTDLTSWTKIGSAQNWSSVACGKNHTLALKEDGTLWAWGDNSLNQLGDGTTTDSTTPKQIGSDTNWYMVGCTDNGSYALKLSGNSTYPYYLYRWGKPVAAYSGTISTPTLWITTLDSSPNTTYVERFDCGRDHIVMQTSNNLYYTGGTTAVEITDPVTTTPYGPQKFWCRDISAGAYHTNYYRSPYPFYPTYQRGIWGIGDANRGNPSSSGTPTLVVAGEIVDAVNSSGTMTSIRQQAGASLTQARIWGTTSANNNYQSQTTIGTVTDYSGVNAPYTFINAPAGNDVFRRTRDTGLIAQYGTTWTNLSTDINYTAFLAGFAESGTTSRRLIALKYPTPTSSFTVSTTNNVATVTNTSTNALTYMINWGDGSTTSISSGAGTPGGGTISHTYTPSSDTEFTITLYSYGDTLDSRVITASSTGTSKCYSTQSPTFSVVSDNTGSIVTVLNTSPNTLGHTSIFGAGNKWRWEWGDTTTTDVVVGASASGDINIPITHTYTFTAGQISAGLPVNFTVTLKAYNGHPSSPFSSASTVVTTVPLNPSFPNRTYPEDPDTPDILGVRQTITWGQA